MTDLSAVLASVHADIEEHDQAAADLDTEPSDYVEVRRSDLEALVTAAEHHQHCHSGWLNLGPDGFRKLRERMEAGRV